MSFILGLFYILVTGAVLTSMVVLLLKGKDEKSKNIFLISQGMAVFWCSSQILCHLSKNIIELKISYMLGNIGICFIGVCWYYFAVLYTGNELTPIKKYAPLVLSVMHYIMVLTNDFHHLYYKSFSMEKVEHNIFFYSNVVMTYMLIVLGSAIIYAKMVKDKEKGTDKILVATSVLIPVCFNVLYLSGIVKAKFDITPMGFGISIILVLFATLKYSFLDFERQLEVTNEKLLLEKERNRIAQQVHDTAGHTLTMIQSYMKLAQIKLNETQNIENEVNEEVNEYLSQARTLTSQGIKELREAINQMRSEESYELVTKAVKQLTQQVKEIPVMVTIQGDDDEKYSHLSRVIYDTVRETITNTLKYSKADKMEIILRFKESGIDVIMSDDGVGCEVIKENNGLRGIRERVEKAGGTVRFMSSESEGFLTRVNLPLKKD